MAENWLPIAEAARLADVSNVQWLHKLRKKGELPAYCQQKGQLKYWYVDINCERFQRLLHRNNKDYQPEPPSTREIIDWDEWEAMCRCGEEIVTKACSERTIKNYRRLIEKFLRAYGPLTEKLLELL
jgi:hypothetical protein